MHGVVLYDVPADTLFIDPELGLDGTVELVMALLDRAGYPLREEEVRGGVAEFLGLLGCPERVLQPVLTEGDRGRKRSSDDGK
jgi:hypothetical protein